MNESGGGLPIGGYREVILGALRKKIEAEEGPPRSFGGEFGLYGYVLLGTGMAICVCIIVTGVWDQRFGTIVSGASGTLLFGWFGYLYLQQDRWFDLVFPGMLAKSDIAVKIASGPSELDDIYDYTPAVFRVLLATRSKSVEKWVVTVAWHIEWYLKPPSTYIRWEWIVILVILIVSAALAVPGMINPQSSNVSAPAILLLLFIFFPLSMSRRRAYLSLKALHRHLQNCFYD